VNPKSGERLTARTNGKREERRFDRKTGQWTLEEKENRRAGYDLTFSVPKSLSIYLARTQDGLAERLTHQALERTMAELEAQMATRVRGKGADGQERHENRTTGEMVYATFVHRESRPIQGRADMHWHAHVFAMNATYDPVEQRWKAGEFSDLKAQAPWFQENFHHRLAENLHQAGYGIRRTEKGWELACITDEEVQTFSKRTRQVEEEARTNDRKLWASARALAKEQNIDLADAYAIRKAELGGKTRKAKGEATLSPEGRREDWRRQMGAGRWAPSVGIS
jgi:conjugative relaxase-like TrwC/TraI family protein